MALRMREDNVPHVMFNTDIVIIDEMSMVNIDLMDCVWNALLTNSSIVFIGDCNQLPPIGPGYPFRDIVDLSLVETITLKTIMRHDGVLADNCDKVLHEGAVAESCTNIKPSPWVVDNGCPDCEDVPRKIIKYFKGRIQEYYGCTLREIQILSPLRDGPAGTRNLNRIIQAIVHGLEIDDVKEGSPIRPLIGDKVIQLRNNYDTGIMNGSMGVVINIDDSGSYWIQWEGEKEVLECQKDAVRDIDLGYAITYHKSQGSEYKIVAVICHSAHSRMLTRNLLYTGVTRARKYCYILGNQAGFNVAARALEHPRHTYLRYCLDKGLI
jgi:exodeoxyribonuclease V alpha subunit